MHRGFSFLRDFPCRSSRKGNARSISRKVYWTYCMQRTAARPVREIFDRAPHGVHLPQARVCRLVERPRGVVPSENRSGGPRGTARPQPSLSGARTRQPGRPAGRRVPLAASATGRDRGPWRSGGRWPDVSCSRRRSRQGGKSSKEPGQGTGGPPVIVGRRYTVRCPRSALGYGRQVRLEDRHPRLRDKRAAWFMATARHPGRSRSDAGNRPTRRVCTRQCQDPVNPPPRLTPRPRRR